MRLRIAVNTAQPQTTNLVKHYEVSFVTRLYSFSSMNFGDDKCGLRSRKVERSCECAHVGVMNLDGLQLNGSQRSVCQAHTEHRKGETTYFVQRPLAHLPLPQ